MFFYHSEYLLWLFILPLFLAIYILRSLIRKNKVKKWLGDQSDFLRNSISEKKRHTKMLLRLGVLALLIIAFARPQGEGEKIELKNKGVHILLLIDTSNSMLAEDIKPNRLSFLKREISRLIDISSGDQMALGVFANSAVSIAPFTNDLSAIKSYLQDISTNYLTNQGTNFERAFQFSSKVFETIKENEHEKSIKILIIASDGEDHSKQTRKAITNLVNKKIRIFTLAFGTKQGGVIPIKNDGGEIKEYKKTPSGQLVITQLKDQSLKKFARWGKGSYYHVNYGGQAIKRLREDLDHVEKTLFEKIDYIKKREYYQWFLIFALVLALIELILTDRSFKKLNRNSRD